MTRFMHSIVLTVLAGLSGCANPTSADVSMSPAAPGFDLGPSGEPVQAALAGEGHERRLPTNRQYQRIHEAHEDAHATGIVNTVDIAEHKLNISHNPIPEIGWPAMTMDFPVAPSVDLKAIRPAAHVSFTLEKGADGMYRIVAVHPAGGGK